MTMIGYIALHRKLSDNPLWTCEPFTRGQAWVDLLLLANYKDDFYYVRGVKVVVKRGEIRWSEPRLSERWQWSRTKLRKFLNDLEKEQQITQQKSNIVQTITLVNYDEYQKKEQQVIQQKDSRKTAERHIQEREERKEEDIIEKFKDSGTKEKTKKKIFTPPTQTEVIDFFKSKGADEKKAITAFEHYNLGHWTDSHGAPVKNWKQKMNTNWINGHHYGQSDRKPNNTNNNYQPVNERAL
jgi:hypothetical protein